MWFDLLDPELEDKFARDAKAFSEQIIAQNDAIEWVVVDEIQKIPSLLDQVHPLIESTNIKFALTGSSARKLKHGSANLLAGRAFVNELFPLTAKEMGDAFELDRCLRFGTLPKVIQLPTDLEKSEFLRAYALVYLKEEIWNEHLIRNLDPFRRFLETAAQLNSEILNYTRIADDVGSDVKTVQSYYEILSDTLIGFFLEPYHRSIRKQQRQSPKFYFFDLGVRRSLARQLNQTLDPSTFGYGKIFEHFIVAEIFRLNVYLRKDWKLSYLQTKDGGEIDLIIETSSRKTFLVEIKSSHFIDERHPTHLNRFMGDFPQAEGIVLSQETAPRRLGDIRILPWRMGLDVLCEEG